MNKEKLKVRFEEITEETFEHPQFTKIKVWIATYGENVNGSNITKEAFEKAISSLYNVPILGEWSETIEDFKGHGGKLEITDEGIKYIETTKAYGVIPESCNPRWEFDDEGVEYLVCDGYLWTGRYDEASKVMDNTCNQSMEITVSDSFEDDKKFVVINEFTFTGICILGENTQPCFPGAKVVYSLNKDEYKQEFQTMLNEIKNVDFSKGGNNVEDEKRKEIINKFTNLKGENFENIINNKELTLEELENQLFSLSVNDLERKIREALLEHKHVHTDWWGDTYECQKYYLTDVLATENIAICEDSECWYRFYGIPYTVEGDVVALDITNVKRYIRGDWREFQEGEKELVSNIFEVEIKHNKEKVEEVNSNFSKTKEDLDSLKCDFTDLKEKYSTIEKDNGELAEFKANIIKEQKDEVLNSIFEKYSVLKEVDGYSDIYEKRYELNENIIEKELKVMAFDNGISINKNESKNFSSKQIKIPVLNKEVGEYGAWSVLDKYIKE